MLLILLKVVSYISLAYNEHSSNFMSSLNAIFKRIKKCPQLLLVQTQME